MRVVIAEDGALFRDGLARLLAEHGTQVAGTAADGPSLLELVAATVPDVAIVDVRMPPGQRSEGVEAALRIRREHPGTGVLLLSNHIETHHTLRLLSDDAHGVGYLLKDRVADAAELLGALRRVADGGCVVDPLVFARLLHRRNGDAALAALSAREREVLGLMAGGLSNAAVARRLGLRTKTVEVHVRSIFARLGLAKSPDDHRRVLAVLAYLAG
ncbi:response regulator transcription factor [Yinghuangia sp. YIM S09857]|uniref:response regulator transcription factor n=1 Tax=Yinghuangia sp. YIM S09857 TaxID=3436929 RepID=UPI003F52DDB9